MMMTLVPCVVSFFPLLVSLILQMSPSAFRGYHADAFGCQAVLWFSQLADVVWDMVV